MADELRRQLAMPLLRQRLRAARAARHSTTTGRSVLWLLLGAAVCAAFGAALRSLGGDYTAGFHALNEAGRTVPAWLLANITEIGNTAVLGALCATAARRQPQLLIALVIAVLIGAVAVNQFKSLFDVPRPPGVLASDTFRLVGAAYTTGSFPSGHTFATFSVAGVLLAFTGHSGMRAALLAVAAVVGFSRVLIGVHWPLDVLGGAAGGLLTAAAAVWLARRWSGAFHPAWHLAMLALVLVSNAVVLIDGSNYDLADPMARTVVAACTAVLAWEYLVAPRRSAAPHAT